VGKELVSASVVGAGGCDGWLMAGCLVEFWLARCWSTSVGGL
jgi:hypothetical protein